ncbi:PNK3P-domain-containing protein [Microstroma glucosiphilum]|uniref:PNK3P-domain-containing protein n=1 Tax=Pseudomicrostroma glucosiphilum TaxID=1684307 RepID=A0A316U4S7_9BASI|nr:PNK3P-domain-containing protein [Pseudomicrostroma glucosiphilum]PWN20247.1 PNK3P-domain-containing protein [Pseudomicrostroma glucosiphilum]
MAPSASSQASTLPSEGKKRAVAALLDSDGEEIEVLSVALNKVPRTQKELTDPKPSSSASGSISKPVHSFFSKPGSSSSTGAGAAGERIKWLPSIGSEQSCLVGEFKDALRSVAKTSKASGSKRQRIAAFDLDGNLIETSSGRAAYNFVDENDFRIWGRTPKERTVVKNKLHEEHQAGSLILVLTNQLNLDQKAARLKTWKARLGLILRQLDVPAVVFAGTRRDAYRKPGAGWVEELRAMWSAAGGTKELDIDPGMPADHDDQTRSFFVGDAAGRTAVGKKARDFADTDRKLAHNLGWRFLTPEEYFAGEEKAAFEWSGHRPATPPADGSSSSSKAILQDLRRRLLDSASTASKPSLVILVGPQASGKSFFAKKLEAESGGHWVRVNQDALKTKEKCLKVAEEALKAGKSVIVDNTNPAKATRALYTALGKRYEVEKVVCVHFDLTLEEAQHNDAFRSKRWLFPSQLHASSKAREALPPPMPSIAFNSYYKVLEKPQVGASAVGGALEEGFDEVLRVGFEFEGDEEEQKAWRMWYS